MKSQGCLIEKMSKQLHCLQKVLILVCVSTISRKTAGMPLCSAECHEAQCLSESEPSVFPEFKAA